MRVHSLFASARRRGSRAAALAVLAVLASGATLLAACGSSGPSQGASTPSVSALTLACLQVSAVLSDGPGPTVDPVGYAEAQILPLHELHVRDKALASAIDRLDHAYQEVFSTDDSAAAKAAEVEASRKTNEICRGAAP